MYIRSDTDYNAVEEPLDTKKITWFLVKANLMETQREINEKKEATMRQIHMGIIQPNGLPAGLDPAMLGLPSQKVTVKKNIPHNQMGNSNLGYLNRSPQQKLYDKFGIRK
jgi:hypothetical protein